jgi:hypothetical protein
MSHSTRFRSLERPQYVYELSTEWDYSQRNEGIDRCFTFFDTYGDGFTQHSPSAPVQKEWMADCLSSLLFHLFRKPEGWGDDYWQRERQEGIKALLRRWPDPVSEEKIAFAFTLKEFHKVKYAGTDKEYVAGCWYYNLNELKASAHESKRFDKRWKEVPRFDGRDGVPKLGTAEAVFRILCNDYTSLLERYALFFQIRRHAVQHGLSYGAKDTDEYFDLGEHNQAYHPFEALNAFVEGWRQVDYAERALGCWLSNNGRDEQTGDPFKCEACGARLRYRDQECKACAAKPEAVAESEGQ